MVPTKNYLILLSAKGNHFHSVLASEGFVMAISCLIEAKKFDY